MDDFEFVNNNYSPFDQDDPALTPMFSALQSADTIRHYQQQNNKEEVNKGLTWGERLEAGYTGLAHGLTSHGPEQLYRAMRTIGKIVGSDDLQAFASDGITREERLRELDPFYHVPEGWQTDGWGRSLYEGMRGVSSSAYSMLPGAAISLIPGGQVVGLATIGAGAGTVVGLSEYDSFMDDAFRKFSEINPELTRQDVEDHVFWDAVWSGVAEGGIEGVTDIVGGKLIGLVGKAGLQPAKRVLDQLIRNATKTMVLEAGSEVTTAVIQDYIRENAGLDYQGRVAAFKNTLGPALVGGALFGVGGTGLKLAQGEIHNRVDINNSALMKADIDTKALELCRQFREAHYVPQAVDVFNRLSESGADYIQASTMMETIESTAQAWAERNNAKATDWQGDGGKIIEMLVRLENRQVNPEGVLPESLSTIRDILTSELTNDQKRVLTDNYGIETVTDGIAIL